MSRQEQLSNLQNYIKEVDKDITMILQSLQWDRSLLQKARTLSTCKYDKNHKMLSNKLKEHEEICFLKSNGYSGEDNLLPEILDENVNTVVKFSSATIKDILDSAAKKDPLFKRGHNREAIEPLSVERLQATYTADERRSIHTAVVSSVHSFQHSEDFILPSGSSGALDEGKTWLERLAEQRDRRRRRAKYRAPPKTRNYSLVLRDVISAQMELFNELQTNTEIEHSPKERKEDYHNFKKEKSEYRCQYKDMDSSIKDPKDTNRSRHSRDKYKDNEDTNNRRHDKSIEYTRSRDRERSRKESSREEDKHNEYRSEKRHKERDRYSHGSFERKRERYEMPRHEREDRSYRKKKEDYKYKDYKY